MKNTELWLAFKYLKGKKQQKLISVFALFSFLSVSLGVAVLIIVISVMNGFSSDLRDKILGTKAHIVVTSSSSYFPRINNSENVINRVKKIQGVLALAPFVAGQAILTSGGSTEGVAVFGISPTKQSNVTMIKEYIQRGSIEDLKGNGILIGRELALRLNAGVGSKLALFTPIVTKTALGIFSKVKDVRVVGIFKSGMYEYDSSFVYLSLPFAKKLFNLKNEVTGIAVKVNDIYNAGKIAGRIRINNKDLWAIDWMQMNHTIFSALKLEKKVMIFILILVIIVAGFNILSTLMLQVMEKTREIGILKAVGMSKFKTMKIFFLQGLIIALIGCVSGTVIGVIMCEIIKYQQVVKLPSDVYYLSYIPVKMLISDVFIINIIAVLISLLSSIYPAYKASRLEPVDAIRYG